MIASLYRYLKKNPGILAFTIIVITVVTLLLTLVPSDYIDGGVIWQYDKLGHALMFGGWTFLFGLQRLIKLENVEELNARFIFLAGIIFGTLIEILQYILPVNRNADVIDILFDAIGCGTALIILKFLVKIIQEPQGQ